MTVCYTQVILSWSLIVCFIWWKRSFAKSGFFSVLIAKFEIDYSQSIFNWIGSISCIQTGISLRLCTNFNTLTTWECWWTSVTWILKKFVDTLAFTWNLKEFCSSTIIQIISSVVGQNTLFLFDHRIRIWPIWAHNIINFLIIMV